MDEREGKKSREETGNGQEGLRKTPRFKPQA
jgi:hypothetical protein